MNFATIGATLLASSALGAWVYLLTLRGAFWRADQRLPAQATAPAWPPVIAIVPARNEADVIGAAVGGLMAQDYPGPFKVIVVDDASEDGTAAAAKAAGDARLEVVAARPLPPRWAGKVWAMSEGLSRQRSLMPDAAFVWFTDADVAHAPDALRRLVAKAIDGDLDLVSVMVMLSCRSKWERLLIPPFVFFFQKLYPFAWVNERTRSTAGAAGGSMLLRASALRRIGGLARMRDALIDDCALARLIKRPETGNGGAIWLGLTTSSRSLRPYDGLAGIWRMVARSAYTELRYSPLRLAGTVLGMTLMYVVAPLFVVSYPWHGAGWPAVPALAAWGLMALAIRPTHRLYGQSVLLAPTLPLAALLYVAMTVDSAVSYYRGQGGGWKGRLGAGGPAVAP